MKNLLKLGRTLNKTEQQTINGGFSSRGCSIQSECYSASDCISFKGNCKFQCFSPSADCPGVCVGTPI
ncbi:hypothetical protein [Tenacibaculum aiptasiae]|uniref:hypothetical protein n=1 Tax=Tenacibaculum aiptasiae TaxID=426481 RepID=UPI00232ADD35|nr:hypothetical protein [Tenacibaculum aiptasiae]